MDWTLIVLKYLSKSIDNKSLEILEATPEDANELIKVVKTISGETNYLTFAPEDFNYTISEEEKLLKQSLDSDNSIFLVAKVNGKIIGNLIFQSVNRPRLKHQGEISISILKRYWRFGIGSSLIDVLKKWGENSGVKKINLKVRKDNKRAILFFKRKGFEIEGDVSREILINNSFYDIYIMGLKL